jgi:hypothetical protein
MRRAGHCSATSRVGAFPAPPSTADRPRLLATQHRPTRMSADDKQQPPLDSVEDGADAVEDSVSLANLYQYATAGERFMMALASLASFATGMANPLRMLYFGDFMNDIGSTVTVRQQRSTRDSTV